MPVYSSKAVYGDAYQIDKTGVAASGHGNGFVLVGTGADWVQMNSAMGTMVRGNTATAVGNGYVLALAGSSGDYVRLNGGVAIPAGTTVEISMWLIRDSASHNDGSGNGMVLGQTSNKMEDNEFVNLQQADNSSFNSGLEYVPVKWRKSTTSSGPGDEYTALSTNGRIKGDEIPMDNGFGSGGTFHHYRITFTVPAGGKHYRIGKTTDGGAADYTYHHNLEVKMSPVTITSDNAQLNHRTLYSNESKPCHASVVLTEASTATSGEHTPFGGYGGGPAVLSISGGMQYDSTNGKFTPPDTGMYEIHVVGQILKTSAGNGLSDFRIMKRGDTVFTRKNLLWTKPEIANSTNYEPSYVLHGIFPLTGGVDYVQLVVDTDGSDTVSLEQGSTFTIQRVG